MGQQNPHSTFMFSDLSDLRAFSAFKVEKAFVPRPEQRPSSAITYRVVGTTDTARFTLADVSYEHEATLLREMFEKVARV